MIGAVYRYELLSSDRMISPDEARGSGSVLIVTLRGHLWSGMRWWHIDSTSPAVIFVSAYGTTIACIAAPYWRR